MRIFWFSFVVYFVMLLVQPCQDITATALGKWIDGGNSPVSIWRSESDRGTVTEECSSYDNCSCSGNLIECANVELSHGSTKGTFISVSMFREYCNPHITTYENIIWQPPKLTI